MTWLLDYLWTMLFAMGWLPLAIGMPWYCCCGEVVEPHGCPCNELVMPTDFTVAVAGMANSLCTNCTNYNGTYVLTREIGCNYGFCTTSGLPQYNPFPCISPVWKYIQLQIIGSAGIELSGQVAAGNGADCLGSCIEQYNFNKSGSGTTFDCCDLATAVLTGTVGSKSKGPFCTVGTGGAFACDHDTASMTISSVNCE